MGFLLRTSVIISFRRLCGLSLVLFCVCVTLPARAVDSGGKPQPDVLIFSNGDRLTGQMERAAGGKVFFKTEGAGELQVPWGKIKELSASGPFAVISTTAEVRYGRPNPQVPQGSIHMTDQQLSVHSASGEQVIAIKNVAFVVDGATYKNVVEHTPGLLHGWNGSVTGGASTVTSTQNETTYNSGIALERAIPSAAWMPTSYRTLLGFTSSYGKITQPSTPTIKTNIFHGSAEQDKYFSPRFYMLGQSVFDHNSAQGLDLQQVYGGGFGYTVTKVAKQELDLNATVDYTKQQFQAASSNQELVGSTFGNTYFYKFPHGIEITEASSIMPEWNVTSAYSANANIGLAMPVLKKLAFSVQIIDSYLNNPPAGFKANSLQFNTGLTYTLP